MIRPLLLGAAATAALAIGYYLTPPPKPRELTQADVDAFLARKEMREQVSAWRRSIDDLRWKHPDGPRPLEFPRVAILDEPMWDYVEHAIMKGEKRAWTWLDGTSPNNYVRAISGNTSIAISGNIFTCTIQDNTSTWPAWMSGHD